MFVSYIALRASALLRGRNKKGEIHLLCFGLTGCVLTVCHSHRSHAHPVGLNYVNLNDSLYYGVNYFSLMNFIRKSPNADESFLIT